MDLVHRAFTGLDHRDAVLRIALRLGETADLRPEFLTDRQAGSVVAGPVDPEAAGKTLDALLERHAGRHEVSLGIHCCYVVIDSHGVLPPCYLWLEACGLLLPCLVNAGVCAFGAEVCLLSAGPPFATRLM